MYERVKERIDRAASFRWHPDREVEDAWIHDAERELGLTLPPSYKWWLKTYGGGAVAGSHVLTLAPPEFRDDADTDLVYVHRLNRANGTWPNNRMCIYQPSPEELFYFDLTEAHPDGEYPIFREDVFGGEPERYAESFAGFLERLIDERT